MQPTRDFTYVADTVTEISIGDAARAIAAAKGRETVERYSNARNLASCRADIYNV